MKSFTRPGNALLVKVLEQILGMRKTTLSTFTSALLPFCYGRLADAHEVGWFNFT